MERMRGRNVIILGAGIICCAFFLQMVLGAYLARTASGGTQFNFNEDVGANITILINNTEVVSTANLTQINISLPSSFTFISGSNSSTASVVTVFTNTSSTMLSWSNITGPLIRNQTWAYFAFNATAATPGYYNITVYFTNATAANYNANISVVVNDTTAPSIVEFLSPTSDPGYVPTRNATFNVSVIDNYNIGTIVISIYNGSGLVNTSSNTAGGASNTFSASFANLGEGTYTYNATANDTLNNGTPNVNYSATKTLIVDTTPPNITMAVTTVSTSDFNIAITISDSSGVNTMCSANRGSVSGTGTSQVLTESNLNCGQTVTYTVTCSDKAGNSNSNTTSFSTNGCSTSGGGGGGGGSTTTTTSDSGTTWTQTFIDNGTDLSSSPVSRSLGILERTAISVSGEQHFVGIKNVSGTIATVEVSSTPQQATLSIGQAKKFEISGDNYYDLLVTLVSITSNVANVTMQGIHEEIVATNTTMETTSTSDVSATKSNLGIWITALIVILAVAGVAYYLFVVKRKPNYE